MPDRIADEASNTPNDAVSFRGTAALLGTDKVAMFADALRAYQATLTANFGSRTQAQPEDQLKAPVAELVRRVGEIIGVPIITRTEVQVADLKGRPDLGIDSDGLPVGHIELKAPGRGADPKRFADKRSRDQFDKFAALPNLVYTDGRVWGLFRTGELTDTFVSLSFDPTAATSEDVADSDAEHLLSLLVEFLNWQPVVPHSPRALAHLIAPLTRLLRDEVLENVKSHGPLESLAEEWRATLFPDADDDAFADGYAQTFTYALLLARFEGAPSPLNAERAAHALDADHTLLAQVLRVLGQEGTREAIAMPVSLLERIIGATDPTLLGKARDPWLYFYEDFLAAYDRQQRGDRGVFYTPVEIVECQVRMTHELLVKHFDKPDGFGSPDVKVLDPAAGTSTYSLAIVARVIAHVEEYGGPGLVPQAANELARNLNAFEILVGPYAVSHLRLSRALSDAGARLGADGVNVFLTDTLAAPTHEGFTRQAPLFTRKLAAEQERASRIKAPETDITVVIGNPPWNRDTSGAEDPHLRKGGIVRHGHEGEAPLLDAFLEPLSAKARGSHALNLYNDYVYFWRWGIWKVCEQQSDSSGIVSFITASAYLTGPGFAGMREVMRRRFDEIWVIDLGGDGRAKPRSENVFDGVLTPCAIVIGVRRPGVSDAERAGNPATVYYQRLHGTRREKLDKIHHLPELGSGVGWQVCDADWQSPFVTTSSDLTRDWPRIDDLFPWSGRGIQFSRTWPVGESVEILKQRWNQLVEAPIGERTELLKASKDIFVAKPGRSFLTDEPTPNLSALEKGATPEEISPVSFRSFDVRPALADSRVIDRPRPALWTTLGPDQVFFTGLGHASVKVGPLLVANAFVPDLNAYNARGGNVWPVYRSSDTSSPNLATGLVEHLSTVYGKPVTAADVATYVYGVLGTSYLVTTHGNELDPTALRVPVTADADLFTSVSNFGADLAWWATRGLRDLLGHYKGKRLPAGTAKNVKAVPSTSEGYPNEFSYDAASGVVHVGEGEFGPVTSSVWDFEVAGLKVVQSWLAARMRKRSGLSSSPLDAVRPETWTFSREFVETLSVVEHFVDALDGAADLIAKVLAAPLIPAGELPVPSEADKAAPARTRSTMATLFD